jgi:hypothetical protein
MKSGGGEMGIGRGDMEIGREILSRESGKEKTKVRPDCSSEPTQLALCLRLAYFRFKRRELTTRRNPR